MKLFLKLGITLTDRQIDFKMFSIVNFIILIMIIEINKHNIRAPIKFYEITANKANINFQRFNLNLSFIQKYRSVGILVFNQKYYLKFFEKCLPDKFKINVNLGLGFFVIGKNNKLPLYGRYKLIKTKFKTYGEVYRIV